MNTNELISDTERELRTLSTALTDPQEGQCLLCYVYRMFEHGCTGLRWARRRAGGDRRSRGRAQVTRSTSRRMTRASACGWVSCGQWPPGRST